MIRIQNEWNAFFLLYEWKVEEGELKRINRTEEAAAMRTIFR